MGVSLKKYVFGHSKGEAIIYNNNYGKIPATPTPNTPEPPPYTLYNNLASRGTQASAGLYPNSNGITMSLDGTKVYSVNHNGVSEGFTNDAITQYNLSTPWDLTTMSAVIGATISLNSFPSFTDSAPYGAIFSPDGLNLYVAGNSSNRVYRFVLSIAWVVSTSIANSSYNTGLTGLTDIAFSTDGTKMFLINGSIVRRFTLNSAWDITTATNDNMSLGITGSKIHFISSGAAFYTFNGSIVKHYLSTVWDLNTLQFTKTSLLLNTLTPIFTGGIYLSPDESKFFMSGYASYPVKRFDFKTPTLVV